MFCRNKISLYFNVKLNNRIEIKMHEIVGISLRWKKNLLRILKLTCNNMEIIVKKKQKMN